MCRLLFLYRGCAPARRVVLAGRAGSGRRLTVSGGSAWCPLQGGGWLKDSRPPDRSPVMTLPRTVSDVVAEHPLFEIECLDRMFLDVYVP